MGLRRRPHGLYMAIEQERVELTGWCACLANLEQIRLMAVFLPDCPRRWRMDEVNLGPS